MSKPVSISEFDSDDGIVKSSKDKRADFQFDMSKMSSEELRAAIYSVEPAPPDEKLIDIEIKGVGGQHAALMRLDHPVRLQLEGPLGDFPFAFNAQTDIRLTGNVGHGVGEGMLSGAIRVRGEAGAGAGVGMTGGTLAIYGSAGNRCGAGMRGGAIFVRGSVGDETGIGALGGTIVVGGDAGEKLGDAMNNITVFIRGKAKSLAEGVVEAPLRKREELRLGLLLINAAIRGDAKEFRRIIPEAVLEMEQSQRGVINPNWR